MTNDAHSSDSPTHTILKNECLFLFSKTQIDRETREMVAQKDGNNRGASLPSPSLTTVKPNVSCQKNNTNNAAYCGEVYI